MEGSLNQLSKAQSQRLKQHARVCLGLDHALCIYIVAPSLVFVLDS